MNSRIVAILLGIVAAGLATGLYLKTKKADDDIAKLTSHAGGLSNELVNTTQKYNDQKTVNVTLETNLAQRIEELSLYSNKWTLVTGELARTEMSAKSASDAARAEIEKQQKQISDLEGTRDELTKNMNDLTNRIGGLEGQIKETERKLAASEGDRQSLQKELKRLLAEKAELERKFNDLAVLREQVKKLREELHIARRLDFIRRGLYGFDKKGGELLNQGIHSPGPSTLTNNTPGLNVDLSTSGDSKASTNAPAPVTAPK